MGRGREEEEDMEERKMEKRVGDGGWEGEREREKEMKKVVMEEEEVALIFLDPSAPNVSFASLPHSPTKDEDILCPGQDQALPRERAGRPPSTPCVPTQHLQVL
jgi:hypothetical protein